MRSAWASPLLLAASWLFIVPVYESPRPTHWLLLLLVGVAVSVVSLRESSLRLPRTLGVCVIVVSAFAAVLIPFPYGVGPALVAVGCVLVMAHARSARIGLGVLFAGAVLTAQSVVLGLHYTLAPRFSGVGWLGDSAGLLLRAMGMPTVVGPEGMLVSGSTGTLTMALTWETFGVLALCLFAAGAVMLVIFAERPSRAMLVIAIAVPVYAVLRFTVLVMMFTTSTRIDLFWSAPFTLASLVVLPIALAKTVSLKPHHDCSFPDIDWRNGAVMGTLALAILTTVVLLGTWGLHDPGTLKQGRVVMDEGHSDWEWSTQPLDTEWYGEKSGYNYYSLYQYLDLFYDMEHNTDPITDELLGRSDVLIIKTPTSPFTDQEISSIEHFVADGGGLFLIGDHTNVFGTSTNMNPLAREFGLNFRDDATYELTQGQLSEYEPPSVFPHPIVQHLPRFLFATSCSMGVSANAEAVINAYGLKAIDADYSQENFFPAVANASDMEFGPMLQGAASRYGSGRVAAFADSTVFSNFWMFMPGKPELALSYVDWLNRENSIPDSRLLMGGGALLLAIALWLAGRKLGPTTLLVVCLLGAGAGVPISIHGYRMLDRATYPVPAARTDHTTVCFEREYSDFALPDSVEGFMASSVESLQTFYVWNQRLGYVPCTRDSLTDAIDTADVLVVADPASEPDAHQIEQLEQFVMDGGRLLVMGNADSRDAANAFLEPFDMRIEPFESDGVREYRLPEDQELPTTPSGAVVRGGDSIIEASSGEAICAVVERGDGLVAAFSDSEIFRDSSLGNVSGIPSDRQASAGSMEFGLMRFLVEGGDVEF